MYLTLLNGLKDKYISRPFSKRNSKDEQRLCQQPIPSTALLTMQSALPRAAQMGFRGRGAQHALQDLLFAPDPFSSGFYFFPALSFINFMNSFQSTEHSRFCSFPRLTLNVVWKYHLCGDDIWGSMVTSDRTFLFVPS